MNARRRWGVPLVPLYRLGLVLADKLRGTPMELTWPVVSVGSLSAGGAGKTPVVMALARLLKDAGWRVDVLSRGYGRTGHGVASVRPEIEGAAERFGDEPVLLAEKARVAVWVGADRFAAGSAAEARAASTGAPQRLKPPKRAGIHGTAKAMLPQGQSRDDRSEPLRQMHLLDDGFQHRRLGRTVDVVLVTAEDLEDALLPAGHLREPVEALRRADVVVVREEEVEAVGRRVWPLLREGARMWTVRRRLQFPAPMFVFAAGLRPVAFCAIARPEGFAAMLQEAGCGVVETVAFRDHHRYALSDVERVVEVARAVDGSGFVTTEKDAVKLTAAMRARLEQVGPLLVVGLEAEFADGGAVVGFLEARMKAGGAA